LNSETGISPTLIYKNLILVSIAKYGCWDLLPFSDTINADPQNYSFECEDKD